MSNRVIKDLDKGIIQRIIDIQNQLISSHECIYMRMLGNLAELSVLCEKPGNSSDCAENPESVISSVILFQQHCENQRKRIKLMRQSQENLLQQIRKLYFLKQQPFQ